MPTGKCAGYLLRCREAVLGVVRGDAPKCLLVRRTSLASGGEAPSSQLASNSLTMFSRTQASRTQDVCPGPRLPQPVAPRVSMARRLAGQVGVRESHSFAFRNAFLSKPQR